MAALICSNCLTITTTLDVNIGKTAKCPKCGESGKIVSHESDEKYVGRIVMASGRTIEFDAVYMVPVEMAQKVQELYSEAAKKFAPKSIGLGFIGDLSFVMAASAATSAVEGISNHFSANAGASLLDQHAKLRLALRHSGRFCKLDSIRQVQFAEPSIWASVQVIAGRSEVFTMPDDAFFCVRLASGTPTSIRWESVEEYWVPLDSGK